MINSRTIALKGVGATSRALALSGLFYVVTIQPVSPPVIIKAFARMPQQFQDTRRFRVR